MRIRDLRGRTVVDDAQPSDMQHGAVPEIFGPIKAQDDPSEREAVARALRERELKRGAPADERGAASPQARGGEAGPTDYSVELRPSPAVGAGSDGRGNHAASPIEDAPDAFAEVRRRLREIDQAVRLLHEAVDALESRAESDAAVLARIRSMVT